MFISHIYEGLWCIERWEAEHFLDYVHIHLSLDLFPPFMERALAVIDYNKSGYGLANSTIIVDQSLAWWGFSNLCIMAYYPHLAHWNFRMFLIRYLQKVSPHVCCYPLPWQCWNNCILNHFNITLLFQQGDVNFNDEGTVSFINATPPDWQSNDANRYDISEFAQKYVINTERVFVFNSTRRWPYNPHEHQFMNFITQVSQAEGRSFTISTLFQGSERQYLLRYVCTSNTNLLFGMCDQDAQFYFYNILHHFIACTFSCCLFQYDNWWPGRCRVTFKPVCFASGSGPFFNLAWIDSVNWEFWREFWRPKESNWII